MRLTRGGAGILRRLCGELAGLVSIRESLRKGEPDSGFKEGGGHIHTPILLASQCPAWSTLRISVPYPPTRRR